MRQDIWRAVWGGALLVLLVLSFVQALRIGELADRLAKLERSELACEPITRGQ